MTRCEWCGQESGELSLIRHWEEHGGFGPPVYSVCPKCAKKEREGFEAALAEWAAYIGTATPPDRPDRASRLKLALAFGSCFFATLNQRRAGGWVQLPGR